MNILALDLSLTRSGYAFAGELGTIAPKGLTGMNRLHWIRQRVMFFAAASPGVRNLNRDLVVIEDYAFSAHASHAHELGELGGVVRMALFDAGIPFVNVNPSTLKKYATGRGNAKKEEMLAAAIRKLDYRGHSHDEVDALFLLQMALAHYASDLSGCTAVQREALAKVQWPDLRPRAVA